MEKNSLGSFIALLRKEKFLTQKQLAELLNVSDKTVSHWECDENSPDISILPELAKILGVSVDELLKGEKNPAEPLHEHYYTTTENKNIFDKAEHFASKTVNKIKEGMKGDVAERYRYFRLLSLIGTAIACVVLISVTAASLFSAYYFAPVFGFAPGLITLIGSLWTIAISLGFTIGARILFSKDFRPDKNTDMREKEYILKANGVSYNNVFLIFCSLPIALTGIDILPVFGNMLIAMALIIIVRLTATVILCKKGIIMISRKKQLAIKYISIFTLSAVTVSGSLLCLHEVWYPVPEEIIFDNSADFIAFMETPMAKPEDAYLIEGVIASTYPPTTIVSTDTYNTDNSPVQEPQYEEQEIIGDSVMGTCGDEFITFKWKNNSVSNCYYDEGDGTFRVITYEAEIKAKNQRTVDDGIPVAIILFLSADAAICLFLYTKKAKKVREKNF